MRKRFKKEDFFKGRNLNQNETNLMFLSCIIGSTVGAWFLNMPAFFAFFLFFIPSIFGMAFIMCAFRARNQRYYRLKENTIYFIKHILEIRR